MAMVVRSNLMAYNANRQLGMNNSAVSKNLEKLSSGFKINRAADDAAGLAVSEKMKAQIKGLEQASLNSQDGISLVQTAEGALTEVHDMLNRMTELATKSANGTIQDDVDREAIQNEVNKLNDEIDRIAQSTNFNGIKLLDGTFGSISGNAAPKISGTLNGTAIQTTDSPATKAKYTTGAFGADAGASGADSITIKVDFTKADGTTDSTSITFTGAGNGTQAANAFLTEAKKDAKLSALFDMTANGTKIDFEAKTAGANQGEITGLTVTTAGTTDQVTVAAGTGTAGAEAGTTYDLSATPKAGDSITVGSKTYEFDGNATAADKEKFKDLADLTAKLADAGYTLNTADNSKATITKAAAADPGQLTLQIGETGDDFNQVTVKVDNMSSAGIGTNGVDVSNQASAKTAIDTIKSAINKVSTNRSELGALQNRLEHTINNLDVTAENMTNANSRIRDTDMAKQMMEYTKMNVLTQSAQAMLAQANQNPQSILQLLQ